MVLHWSLLLASSLLLTGPPGLVKLEVLTLELLFLLSSLTRHRGSRRDFPGQDRAQSRLSRTVAGGLALDVLEARGSL